MRPALFSIRTKFTLPYILLAVVIAIGGGYAVSQVALNSLEERFTNQLIATRSLASESTVGLESDLLETLRLISHTEGIADALRVRNGNRIEQLVYPIAFNSGDDAVLVLDRRGKPVVALLKSESTRRFDLKTVSEDLSVLAFVSNVLDQKVDTIGDKYSGVTAVQGSEYFFVSGPVKDEAESFFGVVLVGKSLGSILQQLREETLSQVTIYDLALHPVMSSFDETPSPPPGGPASLLAADAENGLFRDIQIGATSYTEVIGPWWVRRDEDVAVLGVALPKGFLVRTSGTTRFNITAVAILAALLATLVGISVSESIRDRILKLRTAATRVSAGDLAVQVAVEGTDELAGLARSFNDMVAGLKRSEKNFLAAYDRTIEGWSAALEMREPGAVAHTGRVVEMSMAVAREMRLEPQMLDHLRRGAFLHDIGNMAIPDTILFKPAELSSEEWTIIKRHPLFAREMLYRIEFLSIAMDIPLFHHERWDGSGYPYGMAGKMIPLAARVFAVVDVWDALTSDRPYRRAWSEQTALAYLYDNSGTLFDPQVVSSFRDIYEVILAIKRGPETAFS